MSEGTLPSLSALFQWFAHSRHGVFAFGVEGAGLAHNEAGSLLLGHKATEAPSLVDFCDAMKEGQALQQAFERLHQAGEETFGYRMQRADGVFLECDYRPYPSATSPTAHVWECRELPAIAEAKAKPDGLYKSVHQLRALVQHLQTGLILEDENRHIVLVNTTFLSLFQIPATAEELLGVSCRDSAEATSLLFANPSAFITGIEHLLRERKSHFNERIKMADGRILLRDYIPIFVDGDYSGHLWQYQDISEQISSAEALQASIHRKSAILSEALDAIITIDVLGDVVEWNPAAEVTFGYSVEEALGQNMTSLIIPSHLHEAHKTGIERYLRTGVPHVMGGRVELEAHHKDGHNFPCELSIAEFQEDGKQYFTGFLRDISQRRKAEAAMVAARDLAESSSKAKDLFLANMSHEIRTPLNVMLGMVELLQDTRPTMTQKEYLRAIAVSGESLLQLINDFLDTSKIEARQIELVRTSFDLHELIYRVVSLIRLRVEPKGVRMKAEIGQSVPQFVTGDPNRLHQILLNLMGNAAKFTQKGSIRLKVESDKVESDKIESDNDWKEEPDVCLSFSVYDTGAGIAEESQPFVFERFFQAERDVAKKNEGTGLGLSICRALVELMGGSLVLESSVLGQGSHFRARLPFAFGAVPKQISGHSVQALQSLSPAAHINGAPPRILLAEDNVDNRMFVERVLQPAGFAIDCVVDGVEVVTTFLKHDYALVLMDIEMPRRDGMEATRFIREWEQKFEREPTPIVALTAHALEGYRQRCIEAGMDDYFTKPIRRADLLSLVSFWTQPQKDILIVDDSRESRILLGKYLESHIRCELRHASSGEEALEACRAQPPSLLILDMELGGISGYETALIMRAEGMDFPILGVSGHDAAEKIEASLAAGCNEYLIKPVRRSHFIESIGRLTNIAQPAQHNQDNPTPRTIETQTTETTEASVSKDEQEAAIENAHGPIYVEVDPDMVELIPVFLANRARDLEQLQALLQESDYAAMARIAHKFKGSSGGYGFGQLSVIGGAIEKAAKAEEQDTLEAHIAIMTEYLRRVEWSASRPDTERSTSDEG